MKSFRVLVLFIVILIALAVVRFWLRWTTAGAATPAECIANYYESLKSGDIEKYLHCLGGTYREEGRRFFAAVCRDVKDLKGVVQQAGQAANGSPLWVDVEEVRTAGIRRLRYHLCQDGGSWVIVAIDPPRETSAPVPYGTPVGDEP